MSGRTTTTTYGPRGRTHFLSDCCLSNVVNNAALPGQAFPTFPIGSSLLDISRVSMRFFLLKMIPLEISRSFSFASNETLVFFSFLT